MAAAGAPPDVVVVHLLDPRVVSVSDHTMPIEWQGLKTDVIAKRLLNASESRKLRDLLRKELSDDDKVPFCGHSPAYAITVKRDGKPPVVVTLCGTCHTWAKGGKLRVLKGNDSLAFLDSILPLPNVFRPRNGKVPAQALPSMEDNAKPFFCWTSRTGSKNWNNG